MRILCVSDVVDRYLYSSEDSIGIKPDVIISCGDLPKDYLDFLMSKYNVPLFFVHGNHDNYYSHGEVRRFSGAFDKSRFDFFASYDYTKVFAGFDLDRKIVNFNGLSMVGFEGCNKYNNGPHQYDQREMSSRVRGVYFKLLFRKLVLKKDIDIVVTHAPPYGIHDKDDIVHVGFKVFLELIEKFRPKYFLHGHTHMYDIRESRISDYKGTKIINCYGYFVLDI
ncbi:MAG: metallophosphoesterase [Brevinematia bacterium]